MPVSPTLGDSYDPLGVHMQHPYPLYARARQEEPVFFSPAVDAWVVTRYEDVVAAVRDTETFSSANSLRPITPLAQAAIDELMQGYPPVRDSIDSDGEEHRRLRAPLARGLSAERVNAVEPFIRDRAEALVDAFAADGHAELMAQYAYPLPIGVIARLFGLRDDDLQVAYDGSYGGNTMIAGRHATEAEQAAGARAMVTFRQVCGQYVRERHAARDADGGTRTDLVSEVVGALAPEGGPLPFEAESQGSQILLGVFLAGHVTTSAIIGHGVRSLLTHRPQWDLLCEQPDLVDGAVEEILRMDTPTHAFLRVTTRPAVLGGVDLPAGAEVLLVYASANRDEALVDRPDVLDVTRPPTRHVSFAAGPHTCVGAGLARRELAVTLQTLTRRLPGLRLAADQEFEAHGTVTVRRLKTLQVTW